MKVKSITPEQLLEAYIQKLESLLTQHENLLMQMHWEIIDWKAANKYHWNDTNYENYYDDIAQSVS